MLTRMDTGLPWSAHEADGKGSGNRLTAWELSTAWG